MRMRSTCRLSVETSFYIMSRCWVKLSVPQSGDPECVCVGMGGEGESCITSYRGSTHWITHLYLITLQLHLCLIVQTSSLQLSTLALTHFNLHLDGSTSNPPEIAHRGLKTSPVPDPAGKNKTPTPRFCAALVSSTRHRISHLSTVTRPNPSNT